MMPNPEMEKPTQEQVNKIDAMLADLQRTAKSVGSVSDTIGYLRRNLNEARILLGSLKAVIGPNAHPYRADETWHERIDRRTAEIDAALK